ncbi:MAG: outer membrane lipoprotein-sorting protein [Chthoniobacterales bacterium]
MNLLRPMILRVPAAMLGFMLSVSFAGDADAESPVMSARDLAASLSARRDGTSDVRLRLEVKQPSGATKIALQLQIKQRRTKAATDLVYQVLWPKERKGEAVLLHQVDGRPATGSLFMPPDKLRSLDASQMNEALFGSDLSYQDVIENFFAWENQAIVGNEEVNRVSCVVLESKPGKGESSPYGSVRSWIDPSRLVPLRVEKYLPSGGLARRIETTRVATDDKGRFIPANLTVRGSREDSVTELDGSRIKHDVTYADREFSPEGLKDASAPSSAPE